MLRYLTGKVKQALFLNIFSAHSAVRIHVGVAESMSTTPSVKAVYPRLLKYRANANSYTPNDATYSKHLNAPTPTPPSVQRPSSPRPVLKVNNCSLRKGVVFLPGLKGQPCGDDLNS